MFFIIEEHGEVCNLFHQESCNRMGKEVKKTIDV